MISIPRGTTLPIKPHYAKVNRRPVLHQGCSASTKNCSCSHYLWHRPAITQHAGTIVKERRKEEGNAKQNTTTEPQIYHHDEQLDNNAMWYTCVCVPPVSRRSRLSIRPANVRQPLNSQMFPCPTSHSPHCGGHTSTARTSVCSQWLEGSLST